MLEWGQEVVAPKACLLLPGMEDLAPSGMDRQTEAPSAPVLVWTVPWDICIFPFVSWKQS